MAGGMANALAGGGSFLTFPTLLLAGIDPIIANATSAATMVWGGVASLLVYRKGSHYSARLLIPLVLASVIGGITGSVLLLLTPSESFEKLVPFLMLIAATVYTFSEQIGRLAARRAAHVPQSIQWLPMMAGIFVISCYGGYFGAGMGVLMIVLFLLTAHMDVQRSAALRFYCTLGINGLAVLIFASRGVVRWDLSIPMAVAAVAGGYLGAHAVRRMSTTVAHRAVLIYAWITSIWLFVR